MKVLTGFFTTESNANFTEKCRIHQYDLAFGDACTVKCGIQDVFISHGIETIGSLYANAAGAGVIEKETFLYIESCFLEAVRKHLHEIDGIWLHLHGASEVEELGSGDHHILKKIREITGPYLPIAVVCDPHGNLTKEYVENCTILRSYRESPHIDAAHTKIKVAEMLCELLTSRQKIHALYRKLPLILGGEQSVSTDEPVLSINKMMDEIENDPRVRSVSWHVGYLRHDCSEAGCGVVAVPYSQKDYEYVQEKLDEIVQFIMNRKHEFHYTGLTAEPDEALHMALNTSGKPIFLTDSGDNTTSGAPGINTYVLNQVLTFPELNKHVLFANITDPQAVKFLNKKEIDQVVHFFLGVNHNELSRPIEVHAKVISKGEMRGNQWSGRNKVWGQVITVRCLNHPVTIAISNCNNSMTELQQFEHAGLNIDEYDLIIVKQGYLFPQLKEISAFSIMSLTDGATPQNTRKINFKRILRPMFPIDE